MTDRQTDFSAIFWGTSEFAVAPLSALREIATVRAVVTAPDSTSGRGNALSPSPVKSAACAAGIPIFQPEKPTQENLNALPDCDMFLVAAYGALLPKNILEKPQKGAVNVHPSLLPRWRGPSPIQAALLAGDAETGVTLIRMDEKMDHGPIVAQERLAIGAEDTASTLSEALSSHAARMIIKTLPLWACGAVGEQAQNEEGATYCSIIKKEYGHINWTDSTDGILRKIRAYDDWPKTYALWLRKNKPFKLSIMRAGKADQRFGDAPGTVRIQNESLYISCGSGALDIREILPEGRTRMPASSFIRGYADINGAVLT